MSSKADESKRNSKIIPAGAISPTNAASQEEKRSSIQASQTKIDEKSSSEGSQTKIKRQSIAKSLKSVEEESSNPTEVNASLEGRASISKQSGENVLKSGKSQDIIKEKIGTNSAIPEDNEDQEKAQDNENVKGSLRNISKDQRAIKDSQAKESKTEKNTLQKRIDELEEERIKRDAKRAKYFEMNQQAIAQEAARIKAETKEEQLRLRLQHREESEKALEDMKLKQDERNAKIAEGNQKLKETLAAKPLFLNFQEKFEKRVNSELEIRKQQLEQLREISKPINFSDLKAHQLKYEETKKKKMEERSTPQNESWSYTKPAFQSKLLDVYQLELEKQAKSNLLKSQNAFKILERRNFFAKIVSENFKPHLDLKKEKEFQLLRESAVTKPREGMNKEERVQEGNSYLKEAIEEAKKHQAKIQNQLFLEQQNSSKKGNSDNQPNFFKISKESLSPIRSSNDKKQAYDYSKNEQRSREGDTSSTYHIKGNKSMGLDQSQFLNRSINQSQFFNHENPNEQSQYYDISALMILTPQERKQRLEFQQVEQRKQLGERYLLSMKKHIHHPHSNNNNNSNGSFSKDYIEEDIARKIENVSGSKKIDYAQLILKSYDEKIQRDNRLLEIVGQNDEGRIDLADRYISSIKAKLSLINAGSTEIDQDVSAQKKSVKGKHNNSMELLHHGRDNSIKVSKIHHVKPKAIVSSSVSISKRKVTLPDIKEAQQQEEIKGKEEDIQLQEQNNQVNNS